MTTPLLTSAPPTLRAERPSASHWAVVAGGARDMLPLAVGYMPFAVTIGAAVAAGPLNRFIGWFGAPAVASGSAYLTLVELLSNGTGLAAAAFAALSINLRLLAFSAGLAPWFTGESRRSRLLLSYFIIDPTYLLALQRFEKDDPGPSLRRWYFLGLGAVLYSLWTVGVAVGIVAGAFIPPQLNLGMAASFMVVGMLATELDASGARRSASIGLFVGVVGLGLLGHLALPVAAVLAAAAAVLDRGADR